MKRGSPCILLVFYFVFIYIKMKRMRRKQALSCKFSTTTNVCGYHCVSKKHIMCCSLCVAYSIVPIFCLSLSLFDLH